MKEILVIGQAPPAVDQKVPYDTTMIYNWLEEIGISKEEAQDIFEWEAVYDKFPGYDKKGSHNVPTQEEMEYHWENSLKEKVMKYNKIWILGNTARNFIEDKTIGKDIMQGKIVHFSIHPSIRNRSLFNKNKYSIIKDLNKFINS